MLGAAGDFGGYAGVIQRLPELRDHRGDVLFAIRAAFIQQLCDFLVKIRLEVAHRQIFQFPLELPYAETVGQRREDAAGLLRDPFLQFGACAGKVAHGLGAFGQFDQHHTDVFHHRQEHLAQGFDLLGGIIPVFFV